MTGHQVDYRRVGATDVDLGRDLLRQHGHVLIEGLVPAGEIGRLATYVEASVDSMGLLADGVDAQDATSPDGAWLDVWRHEPFHELAHDGRIESAVRALLGCDELITHPRKVLRCVRGMDNEVLAGWHQDWPEIQGARTFVTAWLPFVPVSAGDGALEVEGSRYHNVRPLRISNRPIGWECDTGGGTVHVGAMRPGDVLVFDAMTVHRSGPTRTGGVRISADFRYQDARLPISANSVSIVGMPYSWDDVYASWENDALKYYWARGATAAQVCDYEAQFDQWRALAALEMAESRGDPAAIRALEIVMVSDDDPDRRRRAMGLLCERYGLRYEYA